MAQLNNTRNFYCFLDMFNSLPTNSQIENDLKKILGVTLGIGVRAETFHATTPLLGSLPELDSMAVIEIITALEDHLGISMEDDEINGETFETFGSLVAFVENKVNK